MEKVSVGCLYDRVKINKLYQDPVWYVKPENGAPSILQADDEDHSRGMFSHATKRRL